MINNIDFRWLKVLVVEDNDFVRFTLRKYLMEYGVRDIFEASNGEDGVKLLVEKPDIVICDISMAPMNGFEFLQNVRNMGGEKVPVIFLTGDANADTVHKALDLTVDAYLLKPVTVATLKAKMAAVLERSRASASG